MSGQRESHSNSRLGVTSSPSFAQSVVCDAKENRKQERAARNPAPRRGAREARERRLSSPFSRFSPTEVQSCGHLHDHENV